MARTVTFSELITRVREATDTTNAGKPSDSDITRFLNDAGGELNSLIAKAYEDHLLTSTALQITSSTYPSASLPDDFVRLRMVQMAQGSTSYDLDPFSLQDRTWLASCAGGSVPSYCESEDSTITFLPGAAAVGTYQLFYIKGWTEQTSSGSISAPYTTNRLETFMVVAAAEAVLRTQGNRQSDADRMLRTKQALVEKVMDDTTKRDASGRKKTRTTATELTGLGDRRHDSGGYWGGTLGRWRW